MFKYEDEYSLFHAKQGMILSVFFGIMLIFIFLISFLLPETLRIARFSLVVLTYLIYLVYFILCVIGTLHVFKNKKKVFPLVDKVIHKIEI